jgi:hypothetical protein
MLVIRDRDGSAVRQSRNLRGIRTYVGKNLVKVLAIDRLANGEGKLLILFDNGHSFETNFADYTVLRDFVRRWRNVYGAPLRVNGKDAGIIKALNINLFP